MLVAMKRMKRCTACGELKPLDHFPKQRTSKGGRRNQCKPCRNKWRSDWLRRTKKRTEYNRRWQHTDAGKANHRRNEHERYWRDVEKSRAYNRAWDQAHRPHRGSSAQR